MTLPNGQLIRPELVLTLVAHNYHVTERNIRGPQRLRNFVLPRQIVMYLLHTHTALSLESIGQILGDRDHTTVLWGAREIARRMKVDTDLAAMVAYLEKDLEEESTRPV